MDIFAGERSITVSAPHARPTHFLDFLFDRGSHGAVADVGVDLYQEITADRHRFGFRMIDIGRNDGADRGRLRNGQIQE